MSVKHIKGSEVISGQCYRCANRLNGSLCRAHLHHRDDRKGCTCFFDKRKSKSILSKAARKSLDVNEFKRFKLD